MAFSSTSSNLVAKNVDGTTVQDTNNQADVFTYNLSAKSTILVSATPSDVQGNNYSANPSISSNGQWLAFTSAADNLLGAGNDLNNATDIFERDVVNNKMDILSVNSQNPPYYGASNGNSDHPSISADGSTVEYESVADNLIAVGTDENGVQDIFTHTWVQPNHVQCDTERGTKVEDETDTEPIPVPWWPFAGPPLNKPDYDSRCQSSTPPPPFVEHSPANYAVFHSFTQPQRPDGVPLRYGSSTKSILGRIKGFGYYKILYKHGYGADVEAQIQLSLQVPPQPADFLDPTTEVYVYAYSFGQNACIRITVVQLKTTRYDGYMKGIITSYAYFNG